MNPETPHPSDIDQVATSRLREYVLQHPDAIQIHGTSNFGMNPETGEWQEISNRQHALEEYVRTRILVLMRRDKKAQLVDCLHLANGQLVQPLVEFTSFNFTNLIIDEEAIKKLLFGTQLGIKIAASADQHILHLVEAKNTTKANAFSLSRNKFLSRLRTIFYPNKSEQRVMIEWDGPVKSPVEIPILGVNSLSDRESFRLVPGDIGKHTFELMGNGMQDKDIYFTRFAVSGDIRTTSQVDYVNTARIEYFRNRMGNFFTTNKDSLKKSFSSAFAADTQSCAVVYSTKSYSRWYAKIFHADKEDIIALPERKDREYREVCMTADGKRLAVGGLDGKIILIDCFSGKSIKKWNCIESYYDLMANRQGEIIEFGNTSRIVRIRDSKGNVIWEFKAPMSIKIGTVSDSGQRIALCCGKIDSDRYEILIIDRRSKKITYRKQQTARETSFYTLKFSPKETYLLLSTIAPEVGLKEKTRQHVLFAVEEMQAQPLTFHGTGPKPEFAADEKFVVECGYKKTLWYKIPNLRKTVV